jgi:hypothetical protein
MKPLMKWALILAVPLLLVLSLSAGAVSAPAGKAKPAWRSVARPTGTIAFVRPNAYGHQRVWLMNADRSHQRAITPPAMNVAYATISPTAGESHSAGSSLRLDGCRATST